MYKSASRSFNFDQEDQEVLKRYFDIADLVASINGEHCEVVVHSLEDVEMSVVKIVNGGISNRKVGDPISDKALRVVFEYQSTGENRVQPYFVEVGDTMLKSSILVITNNSKPIGLISININMSVPLNEFIESFTIPNESSKASEVLVSDPTSTIKNALDRAIETVDNASHVTAKRRNKSVCEILYSNGIFEFKESVLIVAGKLNITRHTIYKFIREFKKR